MLHGMGFTRFFETFLWDVVCHSTTSQRCSTGFRSGDWETPLKDTKLIVMIIKPVPDDFCFGDTCYHAGSSHQKVGELRPWRDAHGQRWYSKSVAVKQWLIGIKGPYSKCAKKTLPTPLHHLRQPGLLTQGRSSPWIHAAGTGDQQY